MNALPGSSTPVTLIVSKTPEQAPPSFKTSPPPLKQYRLPHHHVAPPAATIDCDDELNSSSLISILHGHDVRTPRDFSVASNPQSLLLHHDAETSQDCSVNDEIADFEVAMYSSNSSQNRGHVFHHRAGAAVDSRSHVGLSQPLFPKNEEFSPAYRERFALAPRMKLFGAKY